MQIVIIVVRTVISIHALLAESDVSCYLDNIEITISIHALLAESDAAIRRAVLSYYISIHALLAESDSMGFVRGCLFCVISIHALLAESDCSVSRLPRRGRDFYPRSPCGERRRFRAVHNAKIDISIHALLAESDNRGSNHVKRDENFYPRSPCGERLGTLRTVSVRKTFLSTLSLRRATLLLMAHPVGRKNFYPRSPCGERLWYSSASSWLRIYFYPRSPCGERPLTEYGLKWLAEISIHALLAESDYSTLSALDTRLKFLSTLSLRRATLFALLCNLLHHNFYPRSPCGERLSFSAGRESDRAFLSTLSLRRATSNAVTKNTSFHISIHALLAESDLYRPPPLTGRTNFYPRSPCGERLPGKN